MRQPCRRPLWWGDSGKRPGVSERGRGRQVQVLLSNVQLMLLAAGTHERGDHKHTGQSGNPKGARPEPARIKSAAAHRLCERQAVAASVSSAGVVYASVGAAPVCGGANGQSGLCLHFVLTSIPLSCSAKRSNLRQQGSGQTEPVLNVQCRQPPLPSASCPVRADMRWRRPSTLQRAEPGVLLCSMCCSARNQSSSGEPLGLFLVCQKL